MDWSDRKNNWDCNSISKSKISSFKLLLFCSSQNKKTKTKTKTITKNDKKNINVRKQFDWSGILFAYKNQDVPTANNFIWPYHKNLALQEDGSSPYCHYGNISIIFHQAIWDVIG